MVSPQQGTAADAQTGEEPALMALRRYFTAFMSGSLDELVQHVCFPFFDLRGEELTELRSAAQFDGFRRGLRARMAELKVASGTLRRTQVLQKDGAHVLIEFESTRNAVDGSVAGAAVNLAHIKYESGAWRVWMITVMKVMQCAGGERPCE
jgi:hypothetical protein